MREKKATNIRSSTKEAFVKLPPPRVFGVEDALEYVGEDELVEITAKSVRLRCSANKVSDALTPSGPRNMLSHPTKIATAVDVIKV